MLLAISLTLTTLGYSAWDDSHHAAVQEAPWVATQSGHPLHHDHGHLVWTTPDGASHPATLTPTTTGWDLALTHHPSPHGSV